MAYVSWTRWKGLERLSPRLKDCFKVSHISDEDFWCQLVILHLVKKALSLNNYEIKILIFFVILQLTKKSSQIKKKTKNNIAIQFVVLQWNKNQIPIPKKKTLPFTSILKHGD